MLIECHTNFSMVQSQKDLMFAISATPHAVSIRDTSMPGRDFRICRIVTDEVDTLMVIGAARGILAQF